MRRAHYATATLLVLFAVTLQAQQLPVFRAGVELPEVDVSVVDADGDPITDMNAEEFVVSVDGESRRIASAQFIDLREALSSRRLPRDWSPPLRPSPARPTRPTTAGGSSSWHPSPKEMLSLSNQ